MKKYEKEYQVVHQWCENGGNYEFSDNGNDNYIMLKNGGQIYRYDRDTLVLHLVYGEPIKSAQTLVKDPIKSLHKKIDKEIKIKDTFYFDDCVEIRFSENDLSKVCECLGKKFGTFASKKKHSPTSVRWLPDYEKRVAEYSEIQHKRSHKKLQEEVDKYFKKNNMKPLQGWKHIYGELKNRFNIDVSDVAKDLGVKPINVIDNKNYYKYIFKVIES